MTWEPRGRLGRPGCGDASPERGFRGGGRPIQRRVANSLFLQDFPSTGSGSIDRRFLPYVQPGQRALGITKDKLRRK